MVQAMLGKAYTDILGPNDLEWEPEQGLLAGVPLHQTSPLC